MMIRSIINKVSYKVKMLCGYKKFSMEKNYVIADNRKDLIGKVALVTGGAGGIGRAISFRLALSGAFVFVAGRNVDKIKAVSDDIMTAGGLAKPLILDVSDDKSIEFAIQSIIESKGKLNILVNCAGGSPRERATYLYQQSVDIIDEMIFTNLRGSMLCSRAALGCMVKQREGRIVNISSVLGTNGQAKQVEYTAAKAGVIGYTKALAMEMGQYGITVNCISPGLVPRGDIDADIACDLKRKNYLNKIGTPEHIAETVSFLVSDKAEFITGQNIIVDGGWSLGVKGEE